VIVLDASAAIELLLVTDVGKRVARRLRSSEESIYAPELLDVEVAHALRRQTLTGRLTLERGRLAIVDLSDLPIIRYPHRDLLPSIWALRHNFTAYDAAYVALAEALGAPLLTSDRRLAAAPGSTATFELI
jgi:predicted nucleic acid-binding protein